MESAGLVRGCVCVCEGGLGERDKGRVCWRGLGGEEAGGILCEGVGYCGEMKEGELNVVVRRMEEGL